MLVPGGKRLGRSLAWADHTTGALAVAEVPGRRAAEWNGDVFVGGLRTGEIIRTGQIQRILLNHKMQELRREALLTDWRRRMREVRQGPDGLLHVPVDGDDGAILRNRAGPLGE